MLATRERGAALILALFVVGLVALIAYSMMDRLSRDLRRTELYLTNLQAELYSQGSLLWAADTLNHHWLIQVKTKPIDQLPLASEPREINHYQISSRILDAQSLFNLNNLSNTEWQALFVKLLLSLDSELTTGKAEGLVKAILNHMVTHPFIHASELRLVPGFSAALYQKLLPYVIALPTGTALNISNPGAALITQLDIAELMRNHSLSQQLTTLSSDYFIIETTVEKKGQQLVIQTLAQRIIQNSQPLIYVIWQSRG